MNPLKYKALHTNKNILFCLLLALLLRLALMPFFMHMDLLSDFAEFISQLRTVSSIRALLAYPLFMLRGFSTSLHSSLL